MMPCSSIGVEAAAQCLGLADALLRRRFGDAYSRNLALREQNAGLEGHHRGRPPEAVLAVETLQDVRDAVEICAGHGVPMVAHGAGTSLEGHLSAEFGGLSIDLRKMSRVVSVSPDNLLCRVEAGVTREQLNAELKAHGLFFPIDPGANATLAGMASTRASGTNAVLYGTMRDRVASLQVVLADGRVIETGRQAAKSAAGYDLTALFVGSEGTLGIITEVTLRLAGIPETIVAGVCPFESLEGCVRAVITAMQMGLPVARIELLDDRQVAAVNAYSRLELAVRPTLFLEFHGSPAATAEQVQTMQMIAAENGGGPLQFAERTEDRSRLWKARHEAYFATKAMRPGCKVWSTDVCVPIAHLAESISAARADIDATGALATIVGHVGDGNFHVLFVMDPDDGDEALRVAGVNERMVDRAIAVGGTCTGEHGIGLGKREALLRERGAEAVALMNSLKQVIDPSGLFNPGKIFATGG